MTRPLVHLDGSNQGSNHLKGRYKHTYLQVLLLILSHFCSMPKGDFKNYATLNSSIPIAWTETETPMCHVNSFFIFFQIQIMVI